jgi:hypothetical protein
MTPDPNAAALLTATRAELLDERSELGQAIRSDPQLGEAAALILAAESTLASHLAEQQPGLTVDIILKQQRRRKWKRVGLVLWWGVAFPPILIVLLLMLYAGYTIVTTIFLRR